MASPELKTLGRYKIERVLGKGAMGVVYEGFDPRLSRRVAIKTILKTHLDEQTAKDYSMRFVREAQAVARLNHPNIVQVHDFGEEAEVAYLVLEFIQGKELKSYFDANERFDLKETVRIMADLCEALEFAHNAGIIHRDVKPGNVMIDGQSRVKLTDFGVARIQDVTKTHATEAGTMVGTPAYMSPEQISGDVVDRRTDIFAAGIILYQFLTGDLPFTGAGAWTVAKKIMQDQPKLPSSVNTSISPMFDAVVNKALAKEPAKRYKSARDLGVSLKRALEGKLEEDDSDRTVIAPEARTPPPLPKQPQPKTPAKPAAAPSQSTGHPELELEFWRAIKDGNDPEDFELYVLQFPTGTYTQLAKRKIAKLRGLDTGTRLTDSGVQTQTDVAKARAAEEGKRQADEKEQAALEVKRKAEAEAKARRDAQEQAAREEEQRAKERAVEQAKRDAQAKARREAEARAREEAAAKARRETEEIAQHVAVMEQEPSPARKAAPVAMLLGIGVAVAVAGGGAYFVMNRSATPPAATTQTQTQPKPQQPEQAATPAAPSASDAERAAHAKLEADKAAAREAEKFAKLAAEKEAAEKALREAKAQNEKLSAQRAKEEAARIAAAKAAAEQAAAASLAAQRAAMERAAAERAAADKAAADRVAMEKAAAEQKERQLWESVRNSSSPRELDRYLNAYPSGQYAALARTTQQKLENDIRLREAEAERRRMEDAHRRELEAQQRSAAQAAEAARQRQEAERKKSIFVPPTM